MVSVEPTRFYDFHGLRLGCGSSGALAEALDRRLGRFARASAGPCELEFEYRNGAEPVDKPNGQLRPVYDSALGEVLYGREGDRLFINCVRPIRVDCDPSRGRTTAWVSGALDEHLWMLAHPLFTLPLIETLKRRGLYSLHAAGVALGERAILFPGSSGSGKSTLAVGLLREGFDFLGDDMLFLARRQGELRALAFPEAIDLTDASVRLFPELRDLLDAAPKPGWPKRQVPADRFISRIAWSCRPAALVFPRVAKSRRSALRPLDAGEAFLELAPNILLTEPNSSQAHLDSLSELTSGCPCYRLETGSDFGELAAPLRDLLQAAR